MEKSIKTVFFILIAIVLINLVSLFFSNSNIRSIRKDLENAKLSADSALLELTYSKIKLDSIKADMLVFRSYIGHIQKTVELSDVEKRLKEEKNAVKVAELKDNIRQLRSELDTDRLPDIDVITTKN